jgi:ankyrin repeat protein
MRWGRQWHDELPDEMVNAIMAHAKEASVATQKALSSQPGLNNEVDGLRKRTPLMLVSYCHGGKCSPEAVKALLDAGADVEARTMRGSTALMLAA